MIVVHKISADLIKNKIIPYIDAVQYESLARHVELSLTANGEPWNVPAGVTVAIAFIKPDGKKGLYEKLPDDSDAVTISGATVTAILAPQVLTCAGNVQMSIVFRDGNNATLATFPLIVAVASNPAGAGEVSNDYFNPSLEELHATVVSLTEQLNAAIAELNAARESGELDGPIGPEGPQGEVGPVGPQGPKGDTGAGFKVLGYYNTETDLEDNVFAPQVGDAYGVGVSAPYDIYIYAADKGWVNNGPLQGAKGDTGPQGPKGDKGDKGDTGPQGPMGNVTAEGIANALGYEPAPKSYILHGTMDNPNSSDGITLTNYNWDELVAAIMGKAYVTMRLATSSGHVYEFPLSNHCVEDEWVSFMCNDYDFTQSIYVTVEADGTITIEPTYHEEEWKFTLEDDSTVTKVVRVR